MLAEAWEVPLNAAQYELQVSWIGPPRWGRTIGIVSTPKLMCSLGYFPILSLGIAHPKQPSLLRVINARLCLSCIRNSSHPTVSHFYYSQGNCYDWGLATAAATGMKDEIDADEYQTGAAGTQLHERRGMH